MLGQYPYKKLASYPRMGPEDAAVWEMYMLHNPNMPWRINYDVKVGSGRTPLNEHTEVMKQMWKDLTRLRIDVVAWTPDEVLLIEIKPRATAAALGQILTYSELWQDIHPEYGDVMPWLMCWDIVPDVLAIANTLGIHVEVVPRGAP